MKRYSKLTDISLSSGYVSTYNPKTGDIKMHVDTYTIEELHIHRSGYFAKVTYYMKDTEPGQNWDINKDDSYFLLNSLEDDPWAELIKKETSKLYHFSKISEEVQALADKHRKVIKRLIYDTLSHN